MIEKFDNRLFTEELNFYGGKNQTIDVKNSPYFLSNKIYMFYVEENGELNLYVFDPYKGTVKKPRPRLK